jgi:hypothetical protein
MRVAERWIGAMPLHGHRQTGGVSFGRNVLLLAIATVLSFTCVSAGLVFSDGSSSATGIVPPANPAANTPPRIPFACSTTGDDVSAACIDSALYDINYARSLEGVGPMSLPTNYAELTIPQQFLAVVNLERTARGLSPEYGLGSAMDQQAQQGAGAGTDPHLVSSGNFVDQSLSGRLFLPLRRRLRRQQSRLHQFHCLGLLASPFHHFELCLRHWVMHVGDGGGVQHESCWHRAGSKCLVSGIR